MRILKVFFYRRSAEICQKLKVCHRWTSFKTKNSLSILWIGWDAAYSQKDGQEEFEQGSIGAGIDEEGIVMKMLTEMGNPYFVR